MDPIFATHNHHKSSEVGMMLPPSFRVLSLDDAGYNDEIEESGDTLEENALIKARTVYRYTGRNCFADDSGLEVPALNGRPGVRSSRYAGEEGNAARNIEKLLAEMKAVGDRSARFRTVFALIITGREWLFSGEVNGTITEGRRGEGGFGYDPVFLPEGSDRTFAEMSAAEKNRISHRARALEKMVGFLNDLRQV